MHLLVAKSRSIMPDPLGSVIYFLQNSNSTTKITVLGCAGCGLLLTAVQYMVLMVLCDEFDVIEEL